MWNVLAASVIGTSHANSGQPCQDYCRHQKFVANGRHYIALALSDGAGSASHSHLGSKIAVKTALRTIAEIAKTDGNFDKNAALDILKKSKQKVVQIAERQNLPPRQLACTLLFAVITQEESIFVQLGDGGWVALAGSSLMPVTWPLRGEFANETFFLTSENHIENFQFEAVRFPLDAIAGFTDGIQPVALNYAARSAHKPFFEQLFKVLKVSQEPEKLHTPLVDFLSVESLNERTDDDKTLILAARRELHLLEWDISTKMATQ